VPALKVAPFVAAAVLLAGCGSGAATTKSVPTHVASAATSSMAGKGTDYVNSLPVPAGYDKVILKVPGVGALSVVCSRDDKSAASFVVAPGGATSMIVVAAAKSVTGRVVNPGHAFKAPPAGTVAEQTWQVTPWTSAGPTSLTIWLSVLAHSPPGFPGCGASAQAMLTSTP
jgi:hypothetical protein